MTQLEYRRAYARGYVAGSKDRWPHSAPLPPEPVIQELIEALRHLRNAVDGELAKFDPDDPLEEILGPKIHDADLAIERMRIWLTQKALVEEIEA